MKVKTVIESAKLVRMLVMTSLIGVIGLAVTILPTFGQKKLPTKPAPKKVVDSRLTPPPVRRFNHSLEVTSEYDRFENQTKVTLRLQLNSMESMYMLFGFPGQSIKVAPKAILFQYFMDSEKIFLTPKEAIFLTDRDRFRIKLISLPELDNGKVPFAASIDYQTFLRIANGESVAFKIGETENYFDDEGLEALKDFASRTGPNAARSEEVAQKTALEKEVLAEVNKLRRLTPRVKDQIKTVIERIELLQAGLAKAGLTNPPDSEGISLIGSLVPGVVEESKAVPEGKLKDLITWSMEDLFAGIMLAGGRAGVFDSSKSAFKNLLKTPSERNKLADYPDKDHVSLLLGASRETLSHAKLIAASAGIIGAQ